MCASRLPDESAKALHLVELSNHTTVSVTKGIGSAALGGLEGVALWAGGNCGRLDMHRKVDEKPFRGI